MSPRRYKVKKNKPIFNTRKQGNSYIGILIMVVLLAALVFIGYSVGKPIVEYFSDRTPDSPDVQDQQPGVSVDTGDNPSTQPAEDTDPPQSTESEEIPVEPVAKKDILYISYPDGGTASYESYILSELEANGSGYYGVCIDLVLDGGQVMFATSNELAVSAGAVSPAAIQDLSSVVSAISDAGLVPYARISSLSDHIASSWNDKSLSYMIEGSDSRWYDNSVANGGKPWLSPFSGSAAEYINSLCSEISSAGFAGLIAGELEFPPFRESDLNYIGQSVKSADRYTALVDFSSGMFDSFGTAKEFYIEVSARDIIAGEAEILSDPSALCTSRIYVRFDPAEIGMRISRADGTEVSFEGLAGEYLLKTVFMLVDESLEGSGLEAVPLIEGCEMSEEMYDMLDEMGYEDAQVIVDIM